MNALPSPVRGGAESPIRTISLGLVNCVAMPLRDETPENSPTEISARQEGVQAYSLLAINTSVVMSLSEITYHFEKTRASA